MAIFSVMFGTVAKRAAKDLSYHLGRVCCWYVVDFKGGHESEDPRESW